MEPYNPIAHSDPICPVGIFECSEQIVADNCREKSSRLNSVFNIFVHNVDHVAYRYEVISDLKRLWLWHHDFSFPDPPQSGQGVGLMNPIKTPPALSIGSFS